MQRHWKCNNCKKEFVFNLKERMEHEVTCLLDDTSAAQDDTDRTKSDGKSGNEYYCPICKEKFNLNSIEILKHKRSHTN